MNKKAYISLLLGGCALAFAAGKATASGAPQEATLTYSGTLFDKAGNPAKTPVQVKVRLFGAAADNGDPAKCSSQTVPSEAGTGRFDVPLGQGCVDAVHANSELWAEVHVGDNPVTILPRTKLGAVPYAVEAAAAGQASGKLKADLEVALAAAAKVQALEKTVQDQETKLKQLLAQKSAASVHPWAPGQTVQVTTNGGKLLVHAEGLVNCPGISGPTFLLKTDGTVSHTAAPMPQKSDSYASMSSTFVVGALPAGLHTFGVYLVKDSGEGIPCTCPSNGNCTVSFLEVP